MRLFEKQREHQTKRESFKTWNLKIQPELCFTADELWWIIHESEEALPTPDTPLPNNQSSPTTEDLWEDLCCIAAQWYIYSSHSSPTTNSRAGQPETTCERLELLTLWISISHLCCVFLLSAWYLVFLWGLAGPDEGELRRLGAAGCRGRCEGWRDRVSVETGWWGGCSVTAIVVSGLYRIEL